VKKVTQFLTAVTLLTAVPFAALANHHKSDEVPMYNKMVVASVEASADKLVQLANAIPAEKYGWMPMEGVSSVGEVLLHVAGANYYLGSMLGSAIPEGVNPRNLGDSNDKVAVIATYEASVKFAKKALSGVSETAAAEEIDLFGSPAPRARLMLVIGDHGHEHLGQMIAYARSNKIVPPWSQ
jgi:uncharacterized damage-inducible protein DinB